MSARAACRADRACSALQSAACARLTSHSHGPQQRAVERSPSSGTTVLAASSVYSDEDGSRARAGGASIVGNMCLGRQMSSGMPSEGSLTHAQLLTGKRQSGSCAFFEEDDSQAFRLLVTATQITTFVLEFTVCNGRRLPKSTKHFFNSAAVPEGTHSDRDRRP